MRLLVAGAGGQVGSEIPAFAGHHEVVALTRAEFDLADRDAVEQVMGTVLPDAVINCAAYTNVDGCETEIDRAMAVNALGVRHLAVAAARVGAHVVHISTDYVFAGDKEGPYDEWDTPAPRSVYGRSKLGGEIELARHASSWALVRTSWVYGPGHPRGSAKNFVDTILGRAREGHPLKVVTDQQGCPTYAPDLARVLVRLATGRHAGLFHVTNEGACTWFDLARAAVEEAGLDPGLVSATTSADFPRPAPRPANSVLADHALTPAGIPRPRPWRAALAEHVAAQ